VAAPRRVLRSLPICPLCISTAALLDECLHLRVRFDVTVDARRYNYLTTNETRLQLPLDGVRRRSYFRVSLPAATR
jgi:hypothetical protein